MYPGGSNFDVFNLVDRLTDATTTQKVKIHLQYDWLKITRDSFHVKSRLNMIAFRLLKNSCVKRDPELCFSQERNIRWPLRVYHADVLFLDPAGGGTGLSPLYHRGMVRMVP